MKNTNKVSSISIIMYIVAGLLVLYTLYAIYLTFDSIQQYIVAGYDLKFADYITLFMQHAFIYLVYGVVAFGIGYLMRLVNASKYSDAMEEVFEEYDPIKDKISLRKETSIRKRNLG